METARPSREPQPKTGASKQNLPMREGRLDWAVAILCIMSGAVGLRLVNDSEFWNQFMSGSGPTAPLGTVVREQGGVRYRADGSPVWHDVRGQAANVSGGDLVFTSSDGKAELQMFDGGSVKIMPNSLVVVQSASPKDEGAALFLGKLVKPKSQPNSLIEIKQGSVKLDLTKEAKSVEVAVRDKKYKISSETAQGSLEVSVGGETAADQVRFTSGSGTKLKISEENLTGTKKKTIQLDGGQAALIKPKGEVTVKVIPFQAMVPQNGDMVVFLPASADKPVGSTLFRWEWFEDRLGPKANEAKVRVEIEGKEKKSVEALGRSRNAKVELPQGNYKWRLVYDDSKSGVVESPWIPFSTSALTPPVVLGPVDESKVFTKKGEKKTIPFTWEKLAPGLKPILEIAPSSPKGAQKITQSGELTGTTVALEAGQYSWRMLAEDPNGRQSKWTEEHRLVVEDQALPLASTINPALVTAPVKVEDPAEKAKQEAEAAAAVAAEKERREAMRKITAAPVAASTRLGENVTLEEASVTVKWEPVEGAEEYEVTFFNEKLEPVRQEKVKDPQIPLRVRSADEAPSRYRVQAKLGSGRKIASSMVPLKFDFAAPIPKQPPNGMVTKPGSSVLLTWERTALTEAYKLQVAEDASFKKILEEKSGADNWGVFSPSKPGTYYWRVQARSAKRQSSWSRVGNFSIKK
ncbi:MAG: hypothetical protein AB1540_06840 [Bdellovibrionota bacterium]